uniref:FERM domain-containing protein n=1 Tax=Trichuris muris TaxID=70415 RepID=A0A5S6QMX7_TRIMR
MGMTNFGYKSKFQFRIPAYGLFVVTDLLTKKRNCLQIVNRGDLRLRVSSTEPDVEKLVRSHLLQCSSLSCCRSTLYSSYAQVLDSV